MQDSAVVPEGKPLSQVERVVDTFLAPSKTFTDILRSTSWWLPFLVLLVIGFGFSYAVDHQVGFDQVVQHEIDSNPRAQDQMAQLAPEVRAKRMQVSTKVSKVIAYAYGVPLLIIAALAALILWGSFNFGLGARTTFGQMFAVWMYAGLPKGLMFVLASVMLFAGVNTDSFNIRIPVGTNLAYYMTGAAPWLKAALSFFDIFGLWSLVLLVIGTAIVSRRSKAQAAAVVVGWWVLLLLIATAVAAANG